VFEPFWAREAPELGQRLELLEPGRVLHALPHQLALQAGVRRERLQLTPAVTDAGVV
jgi:hypothetical protein